MDTYGVLASELPALIGGAVCALVVLAFLGAPLWCFTILLLGALWTGGAPVWALGVAAGVLFVLNVPPLRRFIVSWPLFVAVKKLEILPKISDTERTAL